MLLLQLSGAYLSLYGPNDTFVTEASTRLPYATTLFVEPFYHLNIFHGSNAFPWIEAELRRTRSLFLPLTPGSVAMAAQPRASASSPSVASHVILRGGAVHGTAVATVPVEPGARSVTFELMVPDAGVSAVLTDPQGVEHPLQGQPGDGHAPFGGAFRWQRSLSTPLPGEWTVRIQSESASAFMLRTILDSPLRVTLDALPEASTLAEASLPFRATATSAALPLSTHLAGEVRPLGDACATAQAGIASVTVTGVTSEGAAWERSFVRTLVPGHNGMPNPIAEQG